VITLRAMITLKAVIKAVITFKDLVNQIV